ncbi:MAG: ribosome assembly factor SBDS [Thermoproteota archaeon]|nr:MAG: ribosome assembly factor SBDS [Candidatus Korarchaeota archaeon]
MSKPIIIRYSKGRGKPSFELLVKSEETYRYLETLKGDPMSLLAVESVFRDAKRGEVASRKELIEVFGTDDIRAIVKKIIERGKIQITAERREKLIREKRARIIEYIHKNFVNPATNSPHPKSRIERAMREAKVKIDPFEPAEHQIDRVISALRPIIPLKTGTVTFIVTVPAAHWGKARGILGNYGKIKEEKATGNQASIMVEIPVGLQAEFLSKMESMKWEARPAK